MELEWNSPQMAPTLLSVVIVLINLQVALNIKHYFECAAVVQIVSTELLGLDRGLRPLRPGIIYVSKRLKRPVLTFEFPQR